MPDIDCHKLSKTQHICTDMNDTSVYVRVCIGTYTYMHTHAHMYMSPLYVCVYIYIYIITHVHHNAYIKSMPRVIYT